MSVYKKIRRKVNRCAKDKYSFIKDVQDPMFLNDIQYIDNCNTLYTIYNNERDEDDSPEIGYGYSIQSSDNSNEHFEGLNNDIFWTIVIYASVIFAFHIWTVKRGIE